MALKPDYAEAFYNKANAHFIEEQDEKAITYAELAVELNPELSKMVSQWINVSKNRLSSRKEDAEYKRRQLEKSGSKEI